MSFRCLFQHRRLLRLVGEVPARDQFGMPIMQSLKRCTWNWPMWLRPSPSRSSRWRLQLRPRREPRQETMALRWSRSVTSWLALGAVIGRARLSFSPQTPRGLVTAVPPRTRSEQKVRGGVGGRRQEQLGAIMRATALKYAMSVGLGGLAAATGF